MLNYCIEGGLNENPVEIIKEPDFSDCDALVIPNIDILPHNPDTEYVRLCKNMFRYNLFLFNLIFFNNI